MSTDKRIATLLSNDISTFVPQIFPSKGTLAEVKKQAVVANRDRLRRHSTQHDTMGSGFAIIYRHFGHIEVNPQRTDNTLCLRYTYVFGSIFALDEATWPPVNSSAAARGEFVYQVISRARRYHDHFEARRADPKGEILGNGFDLPGHIILSGPRGCGKTFFSTMCCLGTVSPSTAVGSCGCG